MLTDCDTPASPDARRARLRLLLFSFAVAVVVIGAAMLAKQFPLRSPARIALALAQGVGTAAIIAGSIRAIRRLDEMQLRIQLDAMAFAFAGTGILATAYGFLVNAGLPDIDWGGFLWPGMVALWVTGLVIASRRYR